MTEAEASEEVQAGESPKSGRNTVAAKVRADQLLVARGLAESRTRAQALILAGNVFVGDRRVAKAGDMLAEDAEL